MRSGDPALTGFYYDARTQTMAFRTSERRVRWVWTAGRGWGTVEIEPGRSGRARVTLSAGRGKLRLRRIELDGGGRAEFRVTKTLAPGRPLSVQIGPHA